MVKMRILHNGVSKGSIGLTHRELLTRDIPRTSHVGGLKGYNVNGPRVKVPIARPRKNTLRLGRKRSYNLFYHLIYDRNTAGTTNVPGDQPGSRKIIEHDPIYTPHSISIPSKGKHLEVYKGPPVLSPFVTLSLEQRKKISEFLGIPISKVPKNLAQLHHQTAKKAFAGTRSNPITFSELLHNNKRILKSILNHLVEKKNFSAFRRLVTKDGQSYMLKGFFEGKLVYARENPSGFLVEDNVALNPKEVVDLVLMLNENLVGAVLKGKKIKTKIVGKTFEKERSNPGLEVAGIGLSNPANVVADGLIRGHKKGKEIKVYHGCGPVMLDYAIRDKGFTSEFTDLMKSLRDFNIRGMPEKIDFELVRVTHLRVLAHAENKEHVKFIEEYFKVFRENKELSNQKKKLMSGAESELIRHYELDKSDFTKLEIALKTIKQLIKKKILKGLKKFDIAKNLNPDFLIKKLSEINPEEVKIEGFSKVREYFLELSKKNNVKLKEIVSKYLSIYSEWNGKGKFKSQLLSGKKIQIGKKTFDGTIIVKALEFGKKWISLKDRMTHLLREHRFALRDFNPRKVKGRYSKDDVLPVHNIYDLVYGNVKGDYHFPEIMWDMTPEEVEEALE